jgi:hypothetical protein
LLSHGKMKEKGQRPEKMPVSSLTVKELT